MSSGVLLLLHPVMAPISEREAIEALPPPLREAPRRVVILDQVQADHSALNTLDFQDARARQERAFREHVAPVRAANPDLRLHYFGMAPIPLAMHLGHLVGDLARTEVHLLHHARRDWHWAAPGTPAPTLLPDNLPKATVRARGDVVVRISVSHRVDPDDTGAVVPEPLFEIDLGLAAPDEDALARPEHVDAVAKSFADALDAIRRHLPNAERIHVFAAVPVGLAFRLGACPNPTIHAPIQTYQFAAHGSPRHERAFVLGRAPGPPVTLSEEDRTRARDLRARATRELEAIRRFGEARAEGDRTWWAHALPEDIDPDVFTGRWRALLPLHKTDLMKDRVDESVADVPDGFQLQGRDWQLGDELLGVLCRRLEKPAAQDRAVRMLLFHEGLHQAAHAFTRETSREMRPFPRVLEELDYQGDVWAMVHEYGFCRAVLPQPPDGGAPALFRELIGTALETYWAFDDRGVPLEWMEIRRINRYLMWYWQALRVDRAESLRDVLQILAERPLLEIAGPRTRMVEGRIVYLLDPPYDGTLELCVLADGRIYRPGDSRGSRVRDVLDGFRARSSEPILRALKSVFDQVRP